MQGIQDRTGRRGTYLVRSSTNYVLTGLAGGIGRAAGVEPVIIRAAFGALTLAGGFGALLYVLLWAFSSPARGSEPPPRKVLSGLRQVGAVGCMTLGGLIALRETGLWLGDGVVWPAALTALGVSVIWVRSDGLLRSKPERTPGRDAPVFSRAALVRAAIGAVLIAAGMASGLAANMSFTAVRLLDLVFPLLVTVAGVTLIVGPWLFRLAQQVADERRERIRSEERSEMAAHLHDSVLQTLALIQRAGSPREMSTLARVQERELRAWLYGKSKSSFAEETLEAAVDALAGRVEQTHQTSIETVVVGDAPLDERLRALVHACGEAMTNAALHSGEEFMSVYVEVDDGEAVAYVRDQGRGFDMAAVPHDRRGLADSVVGRMKRFGGSATITTEPDKGTEVQLRMPR